MIKKLTSLGGLILFYSVIILGVLLLNLRFEHINNRNIQNNYVTMND